MVLQLNVNQGNNKKEFDTNNSQDKEKNSITNDTPPISSVPQQKSGLKNHDQDFIEAVPLGKQPQIDQNEKIDLNSDKDTTKSDSKNLNKKKELKKWQTALITLGVTVLLAVVGILLFTNVFNGAVSEDEYVKIINEQMKEPAEGILKAQSIVKDAKAGRNTEQALQSAQSTSAAIHTAIDNLEKVVPPLKYRESHEIILQLLRDYSQGYDDLANMMQGLKNGENPAAVSQRATKIATNITTAKQTATKKLQELGTADFYGIN